jgi:hypothetical protein
MELGVGHRERESDMPVRPDLAMQQRVGSQLKTREVSVSPIAGGQGFHRKQGSSDVVVVVLSAGCKQHANAPRFCEASIMREAVNSCIVHAKVFSRRPLRDAMACFCLHGPRECVRS